MLRLIQSFAQSNLANGLGSVNLPYVYGLISASHYLLTTSGDSPLSPSHSVSALYLTKQALKEYLISVQNGHELPFQVSLFVLPRFSGNYGREFVSSYYMSPSERVQAEKSFIMHAILVIGFDKNRDTVKVLNTGYGMRNHPIYEIPFEEFISYLRASSGIKINPAAKTYEVYSPSSMFSILHTSVIENRELKILKSRFEVNPDEAFVIFVPRPNLDSTNNDKWPISFISSDKSFAFFADISYRNRNAGMFEFDRLNTDRKSKLGIIGGFGISTKISNRNLFASLISLKEPDSLIVSYTIGIDDIVFYSTQNSVSRNYGVTVSIGNSQIRYMNYHTDRHGQGSSFDIVHLIPSRRGRFYVQAGHETIQGRRNTKLGFTSFMQPNIDSSISISASLNYD
ncbi:MAG: hypothetical protein N3E37_03900, partial [Candidatus Micrarchaeota archaeon]|nr:hypothetical protein [Candidatus Micrarchaeota archaeon]